MFWKSMTFFLPALLLMLGSSATLAQTSSTAPKQGDMAVSINAGLANSFDNGFEDLERVVTGTFEYFTTPRLSWRGLLGVTSFEADLPDRPSVNFTFVNANVVYNWEGGRIHPYVTGRSGAYQKDASSGLPPQFEETVLGVNGGGGIDWFLGSRWALKFENLRDVVMSEARSSFSSGLPQPASAGRSPSIWHTWDSARGGYLHSGCAIPR